MINKLSWRENTKWKNKFESFSKRILSSKHAYWYECLPFSKRRLLFNKWEIVRYSLVEKGKSPSFNKFLFNSRKKKAFYVNPNIIRDKAINKILDI